MKKSGPWMIVAGMLVVVVLLATNTLNISCDSRDAAIPEAIDDFGDNLEDAAEELTE